ncbi:MAG: hypothetical protein MR727_06205 [Lentisphaeria bacterium]|nr:hypothetical protein [Lentisphaeria bacterium]
MRTHTMILAAALCCTLSAAPRSRSEQVFSETLQPGAYYPAGGMRGYYYPGETPHFILELKNRTSSPVAVTIRTEISDFDGKTVHTVPEIRKTLEANKTTVTEFDLPALRKKGFYVLNTTVGENGKTAIKMQSGYVLTTPYQGKRDPFFGLDQNGLYANMLEGYRRLGAGSLGMSIARFTVKNPAEEVPAILKGPKWKPILESDFTLVGYLCPVIAFPEKAKKRYGQGLPRLSDEEMEHYKSFVHHLVSGTKDRIRLWLIQHEYDAAHSVNQISDSYSLTSSLSTIVLLTREGYKIIKKIRPDANVAVLGAMGIDFYRTQPQFKLSKLILDDLKGDFDFICVDGYNGNWNHLLGDYKLPEDGFRDFLCGAAKLSSSYKKPAVVVNAENGYGYDYFAPFDAAIAKTAAQYTARRLVINRSAPSPYSSWHMASSLGCVWRLHTKQADPEKPMVDLGIFWKYVSTAQDKWLPVPKMAGAAYAAAARALAYVKPSKEIRIGPNVYCYTFTNAKGQTVAALWSIDEPVKQLVDLPDDMKRTDIMGNDSFLKKGKNELLLTKSLFYLTGNTDAEKLNDAIAKADIPVLNPVLGEGYRVNAKEGVFFVRNNLAGPQTVTMAVQDGRNTFALKPFETKRIICPIAENPGRITLRPVNGKSAEIVFNNNAVPAKRLAAEPVFDGSGSWFKQAYQGKLVTPDDVFPKTAMIPEWGLFKMDGSDIYADYALGWDDRNFYLGVRVKDPVHIQRYSGMDLWKDDSIQFAITSRHGIPAKLRTGTDGSSSFGKDEFNISLAFGRKGTELYAHNNGKNNPGFLSWKSRVTPRNGFTTYEVAVPFAELGIKPRKDNGLRFGFVVMDNNRASDAAARYRLVFSHGIAGGQDISALKTIILK